MKINKKNKIIANREVQEIMSTALMEYYQEAITDNVKRVMKAKKSRKNLSTSKVSM